MAILRGAALCLVFAGLAFYGFSRAHEARLRWFDPKPALTAAAGYDVQIVRDRFGVPHISGKRDADVAFGLGYAHSEDDFATIQRAILEARGRLASVDGIAAADSDYIVQLLGIWDAIDERYDTDISDETHALLDGYAAGLNLYAAQHRGDVLPGFAPVRGEDIVALFMLRLPFSYGLDTTLRNLMRTNAVAASPAQGLAIALAPSRSADGATRLLINPQGPFTGRFSWYEARLNSGEGWNMEGGTIPGMPLLLAGAGPSLGWGFAANHPDLVDTYALEANPNDANFYRYDGEWRRLQQRVARIVVRFWGPFRWTLRREILRSVQGPVIRTPEGLRALRYAGEDDVRAVEAFYRLNKAQDFASFNAALGLQAIPSFNFVYADRTGRIADIYNGVFPERATGYDWTRPVPGNVPQTLWRDYLPFMAVPRTVAPPSGFVVAADGSPFHTTTDPYNPKPENFPSSMGIETDSGNGAKRALLLIGTDRSITAAEFVRYKFDLCYQADADFAVLIKDLSERNFAGDPLLEEAGEDLRRYDLCTDENNRGTALAVLTALPLLAAKRRGAPQPDDGAALRNAANHLLAAFGRLDPNWGQVNRLRRGGYDLPLAGASDILRDIEALPIKRDGTFAAGAGNSLILFSSWTRNGQWHVESVVPYGSSQNKGAKHYADQAPFYAQEKLKQISLNDAALMQEATAVEHPGKPVPSKAKAAPLPAH